MPLTPIQVARRANVAVQSVRNWSVTYGEFLSAQARGEAGPRLYDDEDVQVLCAVAALRKSGVSTGDVVERLRQDRHGVVDVVAETNVEDATPQATEGQKAGQNEALAYMVVQSSLQSRLEALERRMDSHTDRLITGLLLGVALTLLVVALVLRVV